MNRHFGKQMFFLESGFVLVATLWVLAGLSLLAAYIDGLTDKNVQNAMYEKQKIVFELDRLSTEATIVYLFATSRMNDRAIVLEEQQYFVRDDGDDAVPGRNLDELRADDTIYAGLGEVLFSVQDEGALAPVNSYRFPLFTQMLKSIGLTASNQALVKARIEDYVDKDQVLSLNGGEYFEYDRKKLPLPPNGLMKTPVELRKLLGFESLLNDEQWTTIRPFLSMRQAVGYNFNVMPKQMLSGLLGGDAAVIESLLTLRDKESISTLQQIEAATGKVFNLEPEEIRKLPSSSMRITTWRKNSRTRHLTGVEFTPNADQSPWRRDYYYSQQQDNVLDEQASQVVQKVPTALL